MFHLSRHPFIGHPSCTRAKGLGMRQSERFMLWIDAVGGYWVCLGDKITLGPAGPPGVGRRADPGRSVEPARLHPPRRRGIPRSRRCETFASTTVRCRASAGWATAAGFSWAASVRLLFRRPHPLSATARLDFVSRHRTQPSADAVLLMADTCVLGPKRHAPRRLPRLDARSDPLSPRAGIVLPRGRRVRDRRRGVQRQRAKSPRIPTSRAVVFRSTWRRYNRVD